MPIENVPLTEEMKTFLQDGFTNYAPALVAISEFRRQVRTKLQAVVDNFSEQLEKLGLPTGNLKPTPSELDKESLTEMDGLIGIRSTQGTAQGYYVRWIMDRPAGEQTWIAAWVYASSREERSRLADAVRKAPKENGTELKFTTQTVCLSAYFDPDSFYEFDKPFLILMEKWIDLLTSLGGIRVGSPPIQI
jgi:hypothetical protein